MSSTEKSDLSVEDQTSPTAGMTTAQLKDRPQGYFPLSREEKSLNRKVNRKFDIFLLPFLSLLYLFSGLDRGNVGNAQTDGFTNDIGISADSLNNAVSLFYITFVIFQPISAGIGKKVGPKYWMPLIMLCWGVFTIAHAWIKNNGMLIGFRLMIGLFEAGFYPTACFYLSTFYTRYDLAIRIGLFYGMYAVAGAFSGAIAYGVFQINGSLYGWQYLFIIEGSLTGFMAIVSLIFLPVGPSTCKFLKQEEKDFAVRRMQLDSELSEESKITRRDVREALKDWKLWYVLIFNILASVPPQAFSVFLPLVVNGLGYSGVQSNLMSVPPYIFGALGLYLFSFSSDRYKERGYHVLGCLTIVILGLILVCLITAPTPRYICLCILVFGSYASAPLTIVWLSGNTPTPGKRALVLGFNGWGNLAGVIGSQLFRASYAPRYLPAFYASLGIIIVAWLGYASYRFTLKYVNKRRAKIIAGWSEAEIEAEKANDVRYADTKYTFVYGL